MDVDAVWQQVVDHFGVERGRRIKGRSCHNFDIWGGKELLLRRRELMAFFPTDFRMSFYLLLWLIRLISNDARQITAGWLRYIFTYSTSKLSNPFTANLRKYNWKIYTKNCSTQVFSFWSWLNIMIMEFKLRIWFRVVWRHVETVRWKTGDLV